MCIKLPLDGNSDVEEQFILRLPEEAACNLREDLEAGVNFKDNFTIEFKPGMRRSIVRYNGQVYQGHIMDLPCIIESMKTTDRKTFHKTADVSQIVVCTQGDDDGPIRGSAAYVPPNSKRQSQPEQTYSYLHGITPPLKNVARRRFRKTRKKKFIDMPQIEKEVKRLLREDMRATSVKWQVIWSDPATELVNTSVKDHKVGSLNSPFTTGIDGEICENENWKMTSNNPSASTSEVTTYNTSNQSKMLHSIEEENEDDEGNSTVVVDHRAVFGELSCSSDSSPEPEDSVDYRMNKSSFYQCSTSLKSEWTGCNVGEDGEKDQSENSLCDARVGDGEGRTNNLATDLHLSDSEDGDSVIGVDSHLNALVEEELAQPMDSFADIIELVGKRVEEDRDAAAEIVFDEIEIAYDRNDEVFHPGGELLDGPEDFENL